MKRIVITAICAFMLGQVVHAAEVKKDLVGYWPLDDNLEDEINGLGGKLVGGAKLVKNGHAEGALDLDGKTGYMQVEGFELMTDTVTIACWINGWKGSDWTGIIASRGANDVWMGFGTGDTLTYVWNNNAGDTWGWVGGAKIPQNTWAFAAITIEPSQASSYIYTDAQGMTSGVNAIKHIEQTIDDLKFGWDECCGADRHFLGRIDEVMIYNRTLSKDDLLSLAESGLSVEPQGKLAMTWGVLKK